MLFVDIEKCIGDFNLKVCFEAESNTLSLLGASGSGKSMTLKCIAGIEKPDKGKIVLNDRVLFDSEHGINLPPQKRKIGYLFQEYALFPNMSVRQNIEVALHHLPKDERAIAVSNKLEEFKLKGLENKKPYELSGGEKQRTALARIMASNPEVLLLDEPFSALDRYLKWQLLMEVKNTLSDFGKPVIFVTHDIDEVLAISDLICVLNDGVSQKTRAVKAAIERPESFSEARLFGCKNFSKVECSLIEDANQNDLSKEQLITCTDWKTNLKVKSANKICGNAFVAGIFSNDIEIKSSDCNGENLIDCTVTQIIMASSGQSATLRVNDTDCLLDVTLLANCGVSIGDRVKAYIDPEKLLILEE